MAKVKAKAVYTPGSQPSSSSPGGRGRPKKARADSGKVRKVRTKRLRWPKDAMTKAMRAVKNHEMSYGEACKHFGVPKTTLYDRLHTSSGKLGRKPELTDQEEEVIVSRPELGKITLKTFLPVF